MNASAFLAVAGGKTSWMTKNLASNTKVRKAVDNIVRDFIKDQDIGDESAFHLYHHDKDELNLMAISYLFKGLDPCSPPRCTTFRCHLIVPSDKYFEHNLDPFLLASKFFTDDVTSRINGYPYEEKDIDLVDIFDKDVNSIISQCINKKKNHSLTFSDLKQVIQQEGKESIVKSNLMKLITDNSSHLKLFHQLKPNKIISDGGIKLSDNEKLQRFYYLCLPHKTRKKVNIKNLLGNCFYDDFIDDKPHNNVEANKVLDEYINSLFDFIKQDCDEKIIEIQSTYEYTILPPNTTGRIPSLATILLPHKTLLKTCLRYCSSKKIKINKLLIDDRVYPYIPISTVFIAIVIQLLDHFFLPII